MDDAVEVINFTMEFTNSIEYNVSFTAEVEYPLEFNTSIDYMLNMPPKEINFILQN